MTLDCDFDEAIEDTKNKTTTHMILFKYICFKYWNVALVVFNQKKQTARSLYLIKCYLLFYYYVQVALLRFNQH